MIDDLLKMQKISEADYDLYVHYQVSELGRKLLNQGTMNTFMEEPEDKDFTGEKLGFNEGRRSVFRDIHLAILRVEDLIRKSLDDTRN
jgi:hypothetical protein